MQLTTLKYHGLNKMEKLKEYISPVAIIFVFIVLILVVIRSKVDDKEKIPVISYDFLNSFAGYRSETFDIIAEKNNEKLNNPEFQNKMKIY